MAVRLACPVPSCANVSTRFGVRAALGGGMHTGLDFPGGGLLVRAPAAGVVRDVYWNAGGGRMVAITHSDDLETRYAHLASATVRKGQLVAAGQLIGVSGSTGALVRGAHLHFEVWTGGRAVDPAPFLAGVGNTTPDVAFGELTPEAPAGTYPDVMGSGGGRCDVGAGWRDASAVETFARPELVGYCVRVTPVDVAGGLAGAVVGDVARELVPIAANVALLVTAALVAAGGIRRILDAG